MGDFEGRLTTPALLGDGVAGSARLNRRSELVEVPWLMQLAIDGRVFVSSDADENDRVTGQTSYAATTPTFLLNIPTGTLAIPLWVHMNQTGTVAGGVISIYMSYDGIARYSSGGTSEAITNARTPSPRGSNCLLYSGATAAAASAARLLFTQTLDPDVTDPNLTEEVHAMAGRDFPFLCLGGPASFLVFTYAATTGVTVEWSIGWAEFTTSELV